MWYNGVGNYLTTFCMLIFVSFQTESILLLAIPKGNEHLQYQKDLVTCLLTYQKSLWLIIPTWLSPNILSITCHSKRALSHLLFQKDHHLPFQKGAVSPAIPKGPSPAIPKGPCLTCLSKRAITCHSKRAITCHSKRALSHLPFQKGPVSSAIPKGPCLTYHSKRALSHLPFKKGPVSPFQKGPCHLPFKKGHHLPFQKGPVSPAIPKGPCHLPFQNGPTAWHLKRAITCLSKKTVICNSKRAMSLAFSKTLCYLPY